MKKLFFIRFSTVLLTLSLLFGIIGQIGVSVYAASIESDDGYIKNGDFEAGSTGSWRMAGTSSIVTGGHDGSMYCLRFSGGQWTNITQDVKVEANTDYRLSGWVKRETGTGAHYLFAKSGSEQCKAINGSQQWFTYPNKDWVQHVWEFNTGTSTSIQIVMCIEDAESVFLFDDITLQKMSDIPPEGEIVNGGFETDNGKGWITGTAILTDDAYNGSTTAFRLTGNVGVSIKQFVDVKGMTDYRLTVHAKRHRSSGAHAVIVRNGSKVIQFKNDADGVINESVREWKEYVYEFNSGYASRITVAMQIVDKGAAFIYDDIKLEEISGPDYSDTQKGDVTLDKNITDDDLELLNKHITKETTLDGAALYAADVNGDGCVDESDANMLNKYLTSGNTFAVPFYPISGEIVAKGSWQVDAMFNDYTPFMTDDYSGIGHRKDQYMRDPVILKWMYSGNSGNCYVLLADNPELTNAKRYSVIGNELSIQNLLVDADYYWAVEINGVRSDIGTFHTAKTVRTLWIDGVSNTRDIGGWKTEDGESRVKYNAAIRGAKLDNITDEGRAAVADIGIKTDLDLRSSGDGTQAPLGPDYKFVRAGSSGAAMYYNYDNRTISNLSGSYVKGTINAFRVYTNPDNYPAYFHCSYGRDRTGTLSFLLLGVLGVSREDIQKDYEMTYLSLYGGGGISAFENVTHLNNMIDWVQETYAPEGTLKEAVEGYLLAAGATKEDIEAVRENMLEPVDDNPVAIGINVVAPSKVSYLEGKDEFDPTDGKVELLYDDGSSELFDLTADMVSGFDNTVVGEQILTVTYEGFTTSLIIDIKAKSLVLLKVTSLPQKTEYVEGDDFDPTGLEVTAYYDNDTFEIVSSSEYEIAGYESSVGQKTLTVSFGGASDTFLVKVVEKIVLGDMDDDSEITVSDALMVLRISIKLAPETPEMIKVGDVSKDGKITVSDALMILRVAAKIVDHF